MEGNYILNILMNLESDGGYTDGYSVHAMLNIPIIVTDFTPSIKFQ